MRIIGYLINIQNFPKTSLLCACVSKLLHISSSNLSAWYCHISPQSDTSWRAVTARKLQWLKWLRKHLWKVAHIGIRNSSSDYECWCVATVKLAIMCVPLMQTGYNVIDEKMNIVCVMWTFVYACWPLCNFSNNCEGFLKSNLGCCLFFIVIIIIIIIIILLSIVWNLTRTQLLWYSRTYSAQSWYIEGTVSESFLVFPSWKFSEATA
jgi:hypothetical protein